MSLSLHLSQTMHGPAADALSPPPTGVAPSALASVRIPATQSQSQRASAASRRKQASTAPAPAAAASAPAAAAAPVPPVPAARSSGSASVIPPTPTPATPATGAEGSEAKGSSSRASRSRASASASALPASSAIPVSAAAPDASHASAAPASASAGRSSAVRPSAAIAAAASVPEPPPDGSSTTLSPFTLDCPPATDISGEPVPTPFSLFTNYQPANGELQIYLLQKDATPRLYSFSGALLSLRPDTLKLSGLKDAEYINYVLHGLAAQDKDATSFEYELRFVQPGEEDDEQPTDGMRSPLERRKSSAGAGAPAAAAAPPASSAAGVPPERIVRAQLKLFKQIGEKVTRIPVCIGVVRFAPLLLTSSRSRAGRQDEAEFKRRCGELMSHMVAWYTRLRAQKGALERAQQRQAEEAKVAEELLAFPAPGISLPELRGQMLQAALTLLNEQKRLIRQRREDNDALRAQIVSLRPKPKKSAEQLALEAAEADQVEENEEEEDVVEDVPLDPVLDPLPPQDVPADQPAANGMRDEDATLTLHDDDQQQAPPASPPAPPLEDTSLSFSVSMDPATSLPVGSPSLVLGGASNSPRIAASAGAGGSSVPMGPSMSFGETFTPPRGQPLVRKRARVVAQPVVAASASSPSMSYQSQGGGSGGRGIRRASGIGAAVAAAGAPAAPAAGAVAAAPRDTTSQVLRALQSRAGQTGPSPPQHVSPEAEQPAASKRQRTQGSMRTSRVLQDRD